MKRAMVMIMLTAVTATAQAPDGSANRAAMDKARFIEGRWVGTGWWQRGPGQRDTATMVETVQRKLDGVAFLIEGRGVVATPGGGERVVHHALAVFSWDQTTGYVMRSWLLNGLSGDFHVSVGTETMTWSRDVPGGKIRNIARFTATEWIETGEFSRDGGTTWMPIMEIRLRRQQ